MTEVTAGPQRRPARRWAPRRLWPHLPATVLIAVYIVHFSWVSVGVHEGYGTFAFDVGIFDQGMWLLSRFKEPFVTLNGRNLFGDHASIVLLPLVPLYWLHPHPVMLLVAQSIALGLAGVPIYLLALHQLKSRAAATAILAIFLLNPVLQQGNLDEFHPESFLVLFAATALYGAVVWKPRLFVIAAIACMLVKEDAVLFVLPLSVWVAVRRDRVVGRRLAMGATAYAALMMLFVMRLLGGGPTIYASRTFPFGGLGGMVSTTFLRPAQMLSYLASDGRLFYLWQLVLPTALVFLRSPGLAAVALPVIVYNVTSAFGYQHQIEYHYSLILAPVLATATVAGIAAFRTHARRRLALLAVTLGSVAAAGSWSLFPLGPGVDYRQASTVGARQIGAILAKLPGKAVATVDYVYAPHVAHREQLYMWPNPFRASYWGRFEQEGDCLADRAAQVEYLALRTNMSTFSKEEAAVFAALLPRLEVVTGNRETTLYRHVPHGQDSVCKGLEADVG